MAFKMKTFKELVGMTKEKLDEALVPLRVRAAKSKAEGEIIKLEEQLIGLETKINEACAKKELDFNVISDLMDDYDLKERRLKQINELVAALFPAE
jgi:hypothetical protein